MYTYRSSSLNKSPLQQKQFHVEAELSDTVKDLKEKVKAELGHPVESQKLIYSGTNERILWVDYH